MSLTYIEVIDIDKVFPSYNSYTITYNIKLNKNVHSLKTYLPVSNNRQKIINLKQSDIFQDNDNKQNAITYSFTLKSKSIRYKLSDVITKNNYKNIDLKYLSEEDLIEVNHYKIRSLANVLTEHQTSIKSQIESLYDYVYYMDSSSMSTFQDALSTLENNAGNYKGKTRLFIALCRSKGFPTRLKSGVILDRNKRQTSHLWAEVYIQEKWVPFDVFNGHFATLPAHYLEWHLSDHYFINNHDYTVYNFEYTPISKPVI